MKIHHAAVTDSHVRCTFAKGERGRDLLFGRLQVDLGQALLRLCLHNFLGSLGVYLLLVLLDLGLDFQRLGGPVGVKPLLLIPGQFLLGDCGVADGLGDCFGNPDFAHHVPQDLHFFVGADSLEVRKEHPLEAFPPRLGIKRGNPMVRSSAMPPTFQ
jgi:hypothetical protein